jgi:hypothetical protein
MVTWKFDEINQRISIVGSSNIRATKAYLYHTKQALVANGWGTVTASSTGTAGSWDYSDLWTSSYDSVLATNAWIVIESVYGQEVCFQVSSDSSADRCGFVCSPGGNFTYGSASATVRPTATDEVANAECTNTSNYNKIHDGDLSLSRSLHVWTDTVGKNFMSLIGRPDAPYLCGNFMALWYLENRISGDTDPWCLVKTYQYLNLWALSYRTWPAASNHGRMRVMHPSAGETTASPLLFRTATDDTAFHFVQHSINWDKYTANKVISLPLLVFTTSNYRYCGEAPNDIRMMPIMQYRGDQSMGCTFFNNKANIKIDDLLLPWDGSSDLI